MAGFRPFPIRHMQHAADAPDHIAFIGMQLAVGIDHFPQHLNQSQTFLMTEISIKFPDEAIQVGGFMLRRLGLQDEGFTLFFEQLEFFR